MEWNASRRIEPIILIFTDTGRRRIIRTAREAAEILIKEWPLDDGEEFLDAVKTCLDVIVGESEPDQLREAMIRAANEAGLSAITVVP
ncbi:DUF982 domain-containing protein [Rhizobium binae]|uniref:DUF982 domain-containing protein n=1 Tax=Rhizobium binae TaxID=1138190 RepID=A0ABV2MPY6_9HYPH|nr:DUF982 domain-containing protein [Rhizobium binae]NKL52684.1 DUF982 domain-containing protein [Rhizobium leguminosarum bv. viciae]MBX4926518.1 DUF982 domain-containing protein [Rhizobium binae]MBX4940800.1 DUF982 domain-containing protein [Rhizobium binae]MBX4947330.1 DUF982 domain-containing protein [Rhizobium binae]MBX4948498.1 DUF982 domain-containing protein [Rhizobium binae]